MIETFAFALLLQVNLIPFSDFHKACLEGGGATGSIRVPINTNVPLHQIYDGAHARVSVSIRGGSNSNLLVNSPSASPSLSRLLTEASAVVVDSPGPLYLKTTANSVVQTIDYCVQVRSPSA